MYDTYMYILANEGVATGDLYPFYGRVRLNFYIITHCYTWCVCVLQQGQCKYDSAFSGAKISGSVTISSGNEANLQAAVASTGPVAVAVDGSNKAFRVCAMHHSNSNSRSTIGYVCAHSNTGVAMALDLIGRTVS